jgi:hypothetical protein
MSTPAMRAIVFSLTLTLLVARVRFTDHAHHPGPTNDLALFTDGFYACANFHLLTFSTSKNLSHR